MKPVKIKYETRLPVVSNYVKSGVYYQVMHETWIMTPLKFINSISIKEFLIESISDET